MKVPIDHRACIDHEGEHTEMWWDVYDFLVGITVMIGGSWVLVQRAALVELEKMLWCPN